MSSKQQPAKSAKMLSKQKKSKILNKVKMKFTSKKNLGKINETKSKISKNVKSKTLSGSKAKSQSKKSKKKTLVVKVMKKMAKSIKKSANWKGKSVSSRKSGKRTTSPLAASTNLPPLSSSSSSPPSFSTDKGSDVSTSSGSSNGQSTSSAINSGILADKLFSTSTSVGSSFTSSSAAGTTGSSFLASSDFGPKSSAVPATAAAISVSGASNYAQSSSANQSSIGAAAASSSSSSSSTASGSQTPDPMQSSAQASSLPMSGGKTKISDKSTFESMHFHSADASSPLSSSLGGKNNQNQSLAPAETKTAKSGKTLVRIKKTKQSTVVQPMMKTMMTKSNKSKTLSVTIKNKEGASLVKMKIKRPMSAASIVSSKSAKSRKSVSSNASEYARKSRDSFLFRAPESYNEEKHVASGEFQPYLRGPPVFVAYNRAELDRVIVLESGHGGGEKTKVAARLSATMRSSKITAAAAAPAAAQPKQQTAQNATNLEHSASTQSFVINT